MPKNIQNNMDNNTYPKTKDITPRQFLNMWSAKMIKFDTQVQRQYAAALQSSERQITESKILKQIFNIIEKVENDELV